MKKRIVVMTGSFNPLTKAHVDVLKQAVDAVDAEKGLFVTSSEVALIKKTVIKVKTRTPFRLTEETRREILRSVSQDDPRLGYGGTEDNNPSGATARALKRLLREYPGYELYYICGADKLEEIPKWTGIGEMFDKVYVLVFRRDGSDVETELQSDFWQSHRDHVKIIDLDGDSGDISSTRVRELFMADKDYRALVPPSAYAILSRFTPNGFPPLTAEQIIEASIKYGGSFGKSGARSLVYRNNRDRFKNWDEELFGDRHAHLDAKVYRKPVTVDTADRRVDSVTECVNADCVDYAERMISNKFNPVIINLASGIEPCGKYHDNGYSPEENLCYASTLSQVLYRFGDEKKNCVKASGVDHIETLYPIGEGVGIYAPRVRFFRKNEKGYYGLRDKPFDCAVITVSYQQNTSENIRTALNIALDNGHDSVVIGISDPCGYDPEKAAGHFADVLKENGLNYKFDRVIFAVNEGKGSKRKPTGYAGKFAPFYRILKSL